MVLCERLKGLRCPGIQKSLIICFAIVALSVRRRNRLGLIVPFADHNWQRFAKRGIHHHAGIRNVSSPVLNVREAGGRAI